MTIRARLTFWFAGILFLSAVLITALTLDEVHERQEQRNAQSGQHEAAADKRMDEIVNSVIWIGIPSLAVCVTGGWWLMRRALAPVATLTRAAQRITERNLSERLPRSGNGDELDRLTDVFNAMTARLDNSFQRIREFTLHASHELKTPLTVLHSETETALQDETLPAAQRERLLSQLDEIQRLSKIVDGLTLLTKADAGQVSLKPEPLALDELVRDAFADAQILARPSDVQVNLTTCEPLRIDADRHRLRQLLLNLTDNAIKYNRARGAVDIALRRVDGCAEISIANTGDGIPPDRLPRVFERFFRGDPAHSSDVDGCGLGLSIAQWIVTAHRGSIRIESVPANLTTVTVRLPLEETQT